MKRTTEDLPTMDTTELDQKIVEAEGQLTAAREAAETICQHFLDVLGREIARWAPDSVKRVVSQQHEVTQKLGSERLGALKTDSRHSSSRFRPS